MQSNGCSKAFVGWKIKSKLQNFRKWQLLEKTPVFEDFFIHHEIKKFLQFYFFETLCDSTTHHSVLRDIHDLYTKTHSTSNRYDFLKNRIFAKECETTPSPCTNFLEKYFFCSLGLGASTNQFMCKNDKNSRRKNFLKIISFVKKTSRCSTLSTCLLLFARSGDRPDF